MSFTIPYTFKAGTKALAQEVNENFEYLKQAFESSIENISERIEENSASITNDYKAYCDEKMQTKLDLNLSNTNEICTDFKQTAISWLMPDYDNLIQLGVIYSYSAPSNGIYYAHIATTPTGATAKINNNTIYLGAKQSGIGTHHILISFALAKGDTIEIAGGTIGASEFIPLKGEE